MHTINKLIFFILITCVSSSQFLIQTSEGQTTIAQSDLKFSAVSNSTSKQNSDRVTIDFAITNIAKDQDAKATGIFIKYELPKFLAPPTKRLVFNRDTKTCTDNYLICINMSKYSYSYTLTINENNLVEIECSSLEPGESFKFNISPYVLSNTSDGIYDCVSNLTYKWDRQRNLNKKIDKIRIVTSNKVTINAFPNGDIFECKKENDNISWILCNGSVVEIRVNVDNENAIKNKFVFLDNKSDIYGVNSTINITDQIRENKYKLNTVGIYKFYVMTNRANELIRTDNRSIFKVKTIQSYYLDRIHWHILLIFIAFFILILLDYGCGLIKGGSALLGVYILLPIIYMFYIYIFNFNDIYYKDLIWVLIPIALASYAYITGKFDTITSPLHLSVLLSILTLIIDIILPYYLFQILTESLLKVPIFIIFIILGSDALRRAKLYLEKLSLILILICGSIAIFMPHPKFISFNMCAIDLIYLAIIELIILFGCAIIVFETEKAHSLIERILSHFAR